MKHLLDIDLSQKEEIVRELRSWAHTFEGELMDYEEEEDYPEGEHPVEKINELADKFEAGICTEDDLEEIDFHIEQINEGIRQDNEAEINNFNGLTLTYSEYLLGKLLETKNEEFAELEYDLQFSHIQTIYKDFEGSDYNIPDEDLYQCITEYLNDTEINLD